MTLKYITILSELLPCWLSAMYFQFQNYDTCLPSLITPGKQWVSCTFKNQTAARGECFSFVVFQHVENKSKEKMRAVCFVIKRAVRFPARCSQMNLPPTPATIFCFAQGACSGQWNHCWIRYTCKPYSIQGDFLQYGQRCWTSMKRRALGALILVFYFIFFYISDLPQKWLVNVL